MSSAYSSGTTVRNSGLCPHGMPFGACPICSGTGGGGGAKKADFSAKPGEMSWGECYSIGQMMKAAQQEQALNRQIDQQALLQNAMLIKFAGLIAEKLANITNFFTAAMAKPAAILNNTAQVITNTLVKPVIQVANQVAERLANNFNSLKEAVVNISDKIAAIIGEQRNALEKFVAENFENAKKKILGLLGLVDVEENTNQESNAEEIENEEKKTSRVKKFYDRILSIFKEKSKL
jgi:hypothetical protein